MAWSREAHHVLDRTQAEQRRLDLGRLGEQLEGSRRDDAERALGADEELLEVVCRSAWKIDPLRG